MRRAAIFTLCILALIVGSVLYAEAAEARRFRGRAVVGPRTAPYAAARAPRYPTYFTPQNPYGPRYYNERYYGGYYGRGFYLSPGGPMYIGW